MRLKFLFPIFVLVSCGTHVPDDSIGQIVFDLVIVLIFILINAFFSAAEMAVIELV